MKIHEFENLEKQAERVLNQYQEKTKRKVLLPIPVESIARSLYNLRIVRAKLDYETSGKLFFSEKLILLNSKDSPERQRFTIAHELAHICLHIKDKDFLFPIVYRDKDCKTESRANIFAAALLMPRKLIYSSLIKDLARIREKSEKDITCLQIVLRRKTPNFKALNRLICAYFFKEKSRGFEKILRANIMLTLINSLAVRFVVSEEAVAWRLKNLGFFDEVFTFKAGEKSPFTGKYKLVQPKKNTKGEKAIVVNRGETFPRDAQQYLLIDLVKNNQKISGK